MPRYDQSALTDLASELEDVLRRDDGAQVEVTMWRQDAKYLLGAIEAMLAGKTAESAFHVRKPRENLKHLATMLRVNELRHRKPKAAKWEEVKELVKWRGSRSNLIDTYKDYKSHIAAEIVKSALKS